MKRTHQIRIQYGDGWTDIEVPASADIVVPGETHQEPAHLTDPVGATRKALDEPIGCPRLNELVGPGARVVIAFPDRVKGGFHRTSHRRVTIPLLVERLTMAGVDLRDIRLVCAIGLHRKNTDKEFLEYLGPEIMELFGGGRCSNHDAEDPDGIISLGATEEGDVVEVNEAVLECDLAIMLGHTVGNPYGGYSGGYKMPCTGLTSWRSIRSHHTPRTMHRDDFVPVSTHSHFRKQLRTIGQMVERSMKAPFFVVDAVLDSRSRQVAVFAGTATEVEKASWNVAAERTEVSLNGEKSDVLVLGMPRSFHYGPGMGSNPVLMLQGIGSWIVRAASALKPNPVVICASVCDGWFNDEWFPPYREVYDLFQRCSDVSEMEAYEEFVCNKEEYRHKYRYEYGYHPFHAFSMLYMGGIAQRRCSAIYIAGAKAPGFARGMGCIPVKDVETAIRHSERFIGSDPQLLVIPDLSKPAVHLSKT